MRRGVLLFAAMLLAIAAWAPAQKKEPRKGKSKQPDMELLEFKVHREDKTIVLDGRVRNISAKPMKGVVLYFELLESDNKMISRLSAEVTKDVIAPGEDVSFETQTNDHSRAVGVRVDAEDVDGRYFTLNKPGPYEID